MHLHYKKAQAATELAVFGAIIIFIIGAIVRSSLLTGYQQNQQLKSMKEALMLSYKGAYGDPYNPTVGRNTSSILYIEDRLSPEVGKYGAMDRQQFYLRGSGTMTNRLMYPVDEADLYNPGNLPTMDIIINGKHFQFTMARLMDKELLPPCKTNITPCPERYADVYATPPDPDGNGTYRYKGWEFKCVPDAAGWRGCQLFYEHVARGTSGWCESDPCSTISAAERFDLNRNGGDFSDDPLVCGPGNPPSVYGKVCREDIAWQWNAVRGIQGSINIDATNANYPYYDIDNDAEEETLYAVPQYYPGGAIRTLRVLDFQEGDINLSANDGFLTDMAIYTRTKEGTYLKVKNGKLYNPEDGRMVRSVSRADQVELIERRIGVSGDTGLICDGSNSPHPRNPAVEVCRDDCFSGSVVRAQTCFSKRDKVLYVRSRVMDRRGIFWLTDSTGGLP